uniref:Clathrin light chain n=1 Tax=Oryzias sinensis TaxID=183150 RepID=A0A8C7X4S1_9TELE
GICRAIGCKDCQSSFLLCDWSECGFRFAKTTSSPLPSAPLSVFVYEYTCSPFLTFLRSQTQPEWTTLTCSTRPPPGTASARRRTPPPPSWPSRRAKSRGLKTTRASASWTEERCPPPWETPAESNGPSDAYAAISTADRLQTEPESLRKWREEQRERLEVLDANSRKQESEWKEKAKLELEEWHARQNEQLEKTKTNNRAAEEAMISDLDENNPGTEWERVARLCDFNPKSSKQAKDVSRMRSVLISLKQSPLVR